VQHETIKKLSSLGVVLPRDESYTRGSTLIDAIM